MEIVLTITTVVKVLLRIYILLLWVRLVIDWILVFNRRFRPRGVPAVLVEFVFTVTDPPIRMFRKVLPPIRLGQVMLDLGWMLTLISCWILLAILPGW
ncbi:YggT family protein [Leucobacter sp. wl10]|uniref:YggT family protein n=1 Tax=Leucobacter sp. wl10 TaxID=2304677 RepID=UPI000E5BE268|nr:YggT family protein [Leucobacter sp. wl10]RGE22531.1 YggT family protein [Leucobacter sp. wl10]